MNLTHVNHGDNTRAMWKGALAGALGGAVASWLMNQAQRAIAKGAEVATAPSGKNAQKPGKPEGGEDATARTAEALSETFLDRTLTRSERASAGPFVHYLFGSIVGAAYGAAAEAAPQLTVGWGVPFGAAVWLGADEIAVPAFGLSKPPAEYPIGTHASALGAHLVYGLSADIVRRVVRGAI